MTADRAATNHQGVVDWPEYAHWTRTVERLDHLDGVLGDHTDGVITELLRPPLRSTDYDGRFGTLYTAVYRPGAGEADYHWPAATWRHSLADFEEEALVVDMGVPA